MGHYYLFISIFMCINVSCASVYICMSILGVSEHPSVLEHAEA